MDLSRFKLIEITDQVSDQIWDEVNEWEYFSKETIGKQLVRAVDSISVASINIYLAPLHNALTILTLF
jgi:hypothetical protein